MPTKKKTRIRVYHLNSVKLAEEKVRLNRRGGASVGKRAKVKKVEGPLKARNGKNCVASIDAKGAKCVKPSKSKVLMDDTENKDVGDVRRKKKVSSFVCFFIADEY